MTAREEGVQPTPPADLLPLPRTTYKSAGGLPCYFFEHMEAYARANVAQALAPVVAERDRLARRLAQLEANENRLLRALNGHPQSDELRAALSPKEPK